MRFWDASAVVPLVAVEGETDACRRFLAEDTEIIVWYFTPVEVASALTRRAREKTLSPADFRRAKQQLALLEQSWSEVMLIEKVRERARRLLEKQPLKAADSLQLAAALIVAEENPQTLSFVTLDDRLSKAAEREGFSVLGI